MRNTAIRSPSDRPPRPPTRSPIRGGLTLIETLVTIGVIGLLAALLVPAVLAARGAAHRAHCANILRQIGLALNAYEAVNRYYPSTGYWEEKAPYGRYGAFRFSPLAHLLPHLDQPALFAATNLAHIPNDSSQENHTVMLTSVGTFLCPADPGSPVPGYGRCNYRFNMGPSPRPWPRLRRDLAYAGPFADLENHGPATIRDGLSQTIGVSERLQGDWTKRIFRPGDYLIVQQLHPPDAPDAALARCAAASPDDPHDSRGGESWFIAGLHYTTYNHAGLPNPKRRECVFGGPGDGVAGKAAVPGVMPARSRHGGGVQAMTMDGAVRFVADGIELGVWRALSTRAGGEVIDANW